MVDIGDFDKVINSQFVKFRKNSDEYITLFNSRLTDESVIDRKNLRGGPLDTASFPLIELTADVVLDKATYDSFRAMRQPTSRGGLPSASYNLDAEAISTGTDDFKETGTFLVRRMDSVAPEAGKYTSTITLRLKNNNKLTES